MCVGGGCAAGSVDSLKYCFGIVHIELQAQNIDLAWHRPFKEAENALEGQTQDIYGLHKTCDKHLEAILPCLSF